MLRELRRRKRREQKTLGELVSELLVCGPASEEDPEGSVSFDWPNRNLRPRVDLEDKEVVPTSPWVTPGISGVSNPSPLTIDPPP